MYNILMISDVNLTQHISDSRLNCISLDYIDKYMNAKME